MQNRNSPPQADELEVSLFGPGFGECAVVHLGQGEWMVVDSCMCDEQSQPIAMKYLQELGVDVARQVRLVAASHWHDDHIRGMSSMFTACESARFVCSAALQKKEFFEIVASSEKIGTITRGSSATEFRDILEELNRRKKRGNRTNASPDHWAADGMTVFRATTARQASVAALSPSPQTINDAAIVLGKLLPSISQGSRRFPRCTPNDLSVALLVHSETCSVLLGGDLECVGDPDRGWKAVVKSPVRPDIKSHAIKIAHHGSVNGDFEDVWSLMMHQDPPAILTPYAHGKKPLPSEEDVARLKSRTSQVYCTSWPPTTKPPSRSKGVERTLREMAITHRAISRRVGQIRLRASLSIQGQMSVETFNGAKQL